MAENKNSKARIAANNRYNEKAYDRINIAVPKGQKAAIAAIASRAGFKSVNSFINHLIDEALEQYNKAGGGFGSAPADRTDIV